MMTKRMTWAVVLVLMAGCRTVLADGELVDLGRAQYHLKAYDEARKLTEQVLAGRPRWLTAQTILLAALWRLGRKDQAEDMANTIRTEQPDFSVARWQQGWPYKSEVVLADLTEPLIEAGLPA